MEHTGYRKNQDQQNHHPYQTSHYQNLFLSIKEKDSKTNHSNNQEKQVRWSGFQKTQPLRTHPNLNRNQKDLRYCQKVNGVLNSLIWTNDGQHFTIV